MHDSNRPGTPALDRRGFLRLGLGGTALLAGASLTAGLSGCATAPAADYSPDSAATVTDSYRYQFLSRDDIVLFEALLPAILATSLPEAPDKRRDAIRRTIERVDSGIHHFGPPNQAQLRQLFDLLNLGITRVTLARVWSSWENASVTEVDAFLNRWRNSSLGLFNNGYIALTKLSNSAYYGAPEQWHLSGYPGPPQWAVDALPQFEQQS